MVSMAEAPPRSCGDSHVDWEGGIFVKQLAVLEAVVELTDHAVEKLALCSGVSVAVLIATVAVVGLGAR